MSKQSTMHDSPKTDDVELPDEIDSVEIADDAPISTDELPHAFGTCVPLGECVCQPKSL
jgi:hypothetical protein